MKRMQECPLCGKSQCMNMKRNMYYCFRYGKTFFVCKDGKIQYSNGLSDSKIHFSAKKENKDQQCFDFGVNYTKEF